MDNWHPRCPPPTGRVWPVPRDPAGRTGPTRGRASGPGWRQTSRGLHVPSSVALTVEQRIVEAAARLPEGGMVTGWAALRLAGARWFDGLAADRRTPLPVPVLLHHSQRMRADGVLVRRSRRPLPEPEVRYGVPCAPAVVALEHELRRCTDDRRAGVMVDMALAARAVDLDRLGEHVATSRRLPAAASYAVARACPDCRSPKESEMLQVWEGVLGYPRPSMNREVLDLYGRLLAVVDLLDEEAGVIGEYNGAAHRSAERQRRDEARLVELRRVGLEPFTIVGGDSEEVWVERMRFARGNALWLPPRQRRWKAGRTVLAGPLEEDRDADELAHDQMMLEHYRALEQGS